MTKNQKVMCFFGKKKKEKDESKKIKQLLAFIIAHHTEDVNRWLAPMKAKVVWNTEDYRKYIETGKVPENVQYIIDVYGNYLIGMLHRMELQREEWIPEKNQYRPFREETEHWPENFLGIPILYLLEYVPPEDENSMLPQGKEERWKNRYLVWNFKGGKGIGTREHTKAVIEVAERIATAVNRSFNGKTAELTLFCIPASGEEGQWRRYHEFSMELCSRTGMQNSFRYVQVKEERRPAHLGGTAEKNYTINENFFRNRNVLIFDDIMTTGKSLSKWKDEFNRIGANVIGALFIGKTRTNKIMKTEYYGKSNLF